MENILEEFWYGNISPHEQSTEKSPAIKELLTLMGRNRDRLQATLGKEQLEYLEKYDDCVNEMHCLMEQMIFSYGFRLGGKFILAILINKDTPKI